MKFELIVTDEKGTKKKATLLKTFDWKKLINDLKKMKGIDIEEQLSLHMKFEIRSLLRSIDLTSGILQESYKWEDC